MRQSHGYPDPTSAGAVAIRLGLVGVRHLGDAAEQIITERHARAPYTGIGNLTDRVQRTRATAEALATAGAFTGFGGERHQDVWAAGAAATTRPGLVPGLDAPARPGMTRFEVTPPTCGHRCLPRRPPRAIPAATARRARRDHHRRPRPGRGRNTGVGRRRCRDRRREHLPQPRGRNRHGQRPGVAGVVAAQPGRRPRQHRAAHPRPGPGRRGRGHPHRRPDRRARPVDGDRALA
nr:hypothetical protein [Amycolatopsis sp. SID8362]